MGSSLPGKGCTPLTRSFFWVVGMHLPAPPGLQISLVHYSELSKTAIYLDGSSQTLICLSPSKELPQTVSPVLLPTLLDAHAARGCSGGSRPWLCVSLLGVGLEQNKACLHPILRSRGRARTFLKFFQIILVSCQG